MQFPNHLKVGMIFSNTFYNESRGNETAYTGIDVQLLKLLAEKLNFQYTIHIVKDGYGKVNENGSWIGLAGALGRGELDISTVYCPLLEERTQVIDYSMPYYTVERTFATAIPKPLPRYYVLVMPFQVQVWVAFLVSVLLVPNVLQQALFRKQSLVGYFINLISCKKMPDKIENSLSFRIFNGSWLLSDTIMRFTYTTVILSFLTVTPRPTGVRNVHDLAVAIEKGNFKYIELKGSANAEFMIQNDSPDIRKIGLAVIRNNWFEVLDFGQEIEDNKAIFGSRLLFTILHGKPPFAKVSVAEDGFGIWSTGVMVKKNFCCMQRLDTMILRINSAGLYQKFIDDESFKRQFYANTNRPFDDGVKKLGLDSFSGIFFLLIILHVASLIIFTMERFYYQRKKRAMR
ncbi:Glutamate receptor like protein [Argiope bruennichi]|uniref:Glutamate receptor like protein n=2 Tax=Argiope bruennichi TaxID=94029 RepID=A0A8T0EMM7_ARGBR|nr:Glutamate receptor like protein [Argiope bruennichi]